MPPVSSRTTSRSVPSMRSRLSGLASSSAGNGLTGRRLANRPRPSRSPSRPCSGRGASGSVVSHFGPPTAPSKTASAAEQRSRTAGKSGMPCSSIEAPPTGNSVISKSTPSPSAATSSSSRAEAITSGPMPSPGNATMSYEGRLAGSLKRLWRRPPLRPPTRRALLVALDLIDTVRQVGQVGAKLLDVARRGLLLVLLLARGLLKGLYPPRERLDVGPGLLHVVARPRDLAPQIADVTAKASHLRL